MCEAGQKAKHAQKSKKEYKRGAYLLVYMVSKPYNCSKGGYREYRALTPPPSSDPKQQPISIRGQKLATVKQAEDLALLPLYIVHRLQTVSSQGNTHWQPPQHPCEGNLQDMVWDSTLANLQSKEYRQPRGTGTVVSTTACHHGIHGGDRGLPQARFCICLPSLDSLRWAS